MKTHSLYPLMFRPQYRDYIWGGDAIATRYNRANTPRPCAESWEICGLPGHESIVTNGPFEGVDLGKLTQTFGRDLIGTKAPDPEHFPLLIKILDVHSRLSVQVHPDAEAAKVIGGNPKHEMWYVLDAAPNAMLWAGLRPNADLTNLAETSLVSHVTHPGEVYDILRRGSETARAAAAETLADVRRAMKIDYFEDEALIAEQARQYAASER